MGKDSGIAWTEHTFNPWRGCKEVSPGCDNCYARVLSLRNPGTLGTWGTAQQGGIRVLASEDMWRQPFKWDMFSRTTTRAIDSGCDRVFCASLADWAEQWPGPILNSKGERVALWPDGSRVYLQGDVLPIRGADKARWAVIEDIVEDLFQVIDQTQGLDWLLLTKRPQNIRGKLPGVSSLVKEFMRRPGFDVTVTAQGLLDYFAATATDQYLEAKQTLRKISKLKPLRRDISLDFD